MCLSLCRSGHAPIHHNIHGRVYSAFKFFTVLISRRLIRRGKNAGKVEYAYEVIAPYRKTTAVLLGGRVISDRKDSRMESAEKMRGEVSYGIHTYLELNDAKAAAGTKDIVLPVYIPANKLVTFGWAPGGASPLAAVSQEIIIGADITRDMMVMGKLIDLPPFSTKFASKLTRMVKYSNSRPQQAVPLQFKLIC